MSTKLENLDITSVDFVPRGANPKADIKVTKHDKASSVVEKFAKALMSVFGDKPEEEVQKASFSEVLSEHQADLILEEVCTACGALRCSFMSILTDEEATDRAALLNQSLAEFNAAMQEYIQKWSGGQLVGIAKSEAKEEENEVNIDKSKLTAEELDFLKKIEEKAGNVAKAAPVEPVAEPAPVNTVLSAEPVQAPAPAADKAEVAKGVDVLAKYDNIMKALDDTVTKIEDSKLTAVAKKYEILGMKTEELVPFFKELKKDPAMYENIIKKFDTAVDAIEASGVFDEIGKRGAEPTTGNAVMKIAKFADEIMKKAPSLGRVKAEQMAWEQHPELVAEYEAQA